MTKQELIDILKNHCTSYYSDMLEQDGIKCSAVRKSNGQKLYPVFTSYKWSTGGASGGSCWGGSPSAYTSDDAEENLDEFFSFLSEHFPDAKFSEVNAILAKTRVLSYTDYEYYGNYTHYKIKVLHHDDVIAGLFPECK